MIPVYAKESFPTKVTKSIFLAGPTPRDANVPSWRKEALAILVDFDGIVYVPEPRDSKWNSDYDSQVEWEDDALNRSDAILFWVPRDLKTLPAFTTNVEFGAWVKSGKVFYGRPDNSVKNRYLDYYATKYGITVHIDLKSLVTETVTYLGNGMERTEGNTSIPLQVYKHPTFQSWLTNQNQNGNTINSGKVCFTFPATRTPFLFGVHAQMHIGSESRDKVNEIAIFRSDVAQVVLYKKNNRFLDHEVVLVREFRVPARTVDGLIHETPGGSSKTTKPIEQIALEEVHEETGIIVTIDRLNKVGTKQLAGTLSAHSATVFSVELTEQELSTVKDNLNVVHGVESDSERTYTEVKTVKELLKMNLTDWSNLGMILTALQ